MKRLAAVAGVGIALCIGAGVASAEYRQTGPTLTVTPATVPVGGTVIASVRSDCVDGSTVDFQIEPDGDFNVGICTNGSYDARLTAPPKPGTYDVSASAEGLDLETKLTVTAAMDGSEEPLPSTGSDDAVPIALIGGVLVVGGGALLGLGRIRQRRVD